MAATPAIAALTAADIEHVVHHYAHDRKNADYGAEAVAIMGDRLGVAPAQIFKTLVVDLGDRKLGVTVLPVPQKLSLKAAAKAFGVAKTLMAPPASVTRATGYVLGGVAPLGQKTALPVVVDTSALQWDRILTSAGKRGLEIEIAPADLVSVTGALVADLTR
ncbi:MAG: aminoacyl-tRNA deacylase [Gordonia sp. (in: high G+C Gram-positive bacteria)]|uniref:aminoacyl-tRNA deacylase n=1 Tax=Gordonia sp. (in: high G+C Gram-positive bacteria) TaxID=84139 RepID=UPI003BB6AF82